MPTDAGCRVTWASLDPGKDAVFGEAAFAARMREGRKARGLSQADLGQKVGLNKVAVLRIETGERHIRLDEAIRIANALSVPLYQMLRPEPLEFGERQLLSSVSRDTLR